MCHGKQGYHDVNSVAQAALLFEGIRGQPLYWYECPNCNEFHLTSAPRYRQKEKDEQDALKTFLLKKRTAGAAITKMAENAAASSAEQMRAERNAIIESKDINAMLDWNKTHPFLMIPQKVIQAAMVDKIFSCV
jgi:hypothetical protein